MHIKKLTRPVTIEGRNLYNRKARITFMPCKEPGILWKAENGIIPITLDLAKNETRKVVLQSGKSRLLVYEHIGSIFMATGLRDIIIQSDRNPPYFGRPGELWWELKKYCIETPNKTDWFYPRKIFIKEGETKEKFRYLKFIPSAKPGLKLTIIADFPDFGQKQISYDVYKDSPEKMFEALTLGWPKYLYWPSLLLSLIPGGPWEKNHQKITWPQHYKSKDALLKQIAWHRLGDLLGALSLISAHGLPAGEIISYRGGHKLDLELMHLIQNGAS